MTVRVLILGVSGMLGNAMLRVMSESGALDVFGTARSGAVKKYFQPEIASRILTGIDVENSDALAGVIAQVRPDVVVNCIGLVRQRAEAQDPLQALPINALLPHRLARLCSLAGARLIHFSTDCVFSGRKGGYREEDVSDAEDLYGRSKFLGEVAHPHTVTLRTSIIGHELAGAQGLVGWFLAQREPVRGYRLAIFSGLPTVELARIVRDLLLPRADLSGLYHVAAQPVSKFELLTMVANAYDHRIGIKPDDRVAVDHSLNAARFSHATGYVAPSWPELVARMRDSR
jgi:dTDP-4-dehydrorhamnose reductase